MLTSKLIIRRDEKLRQGESSKLFVKFRFYDEAAPKERRFVRRRINNLKRDGESNYLISDGFRPAGFRSFVKRIDKRNHSWASVPRTIEINADIYNPLYSFLYTQILLNGLGVNIEFSSENDIDIRDYINLEDMNRYLLTGEASIEKELELQKQADADSPSKSYKFH